ncbi:MAG TPA: LPS export ABC transporter periplasmic protein LptC, partial [Azospirillaceae bacterium]|nr:LPS export ABC transporter periplasmic protein LptC [Azospirillaceae bacterium]
MVQLAKVALPLAALGILALVAAWPSFVETTPPKLAANPTDSDLLQPRYFAVDEKGQPFSLTAKRAKEKDPASGLVDLDEPEAEMTEIGGAWVTIRGRDGEYNRQTKILRLQGDVRILRDDGTEYRTEEAYTDIAAGTAWGDSYIVGQGPQGEVAGQGFRMSDRGKTMVFTNRAAVATPAGAPADAP